MRNAKLSRNYGRYQIKGEPDLNRQPPVWPERELQVCDLPGAKRPAAQDEGTLGHHETVDREEREGAVGGSGSSISDRLDGKREGNQMAGQVAESRWGREGHETGGPDRTRKIIGRGMERAGLLTCGSGIR